MIRATYRFARIPEWVLCHPSLDGTAIRLFGVLDRHSGQSCHPKLSTLCKQMGDVSPNTARRALKSLRDVGAVQVDERFDDAGRQTSNEYLLAGDAPLSDAPPPPMPPPVGTPPAMDGRGEGAMDGRVSTLYLNESPKEREKATRLGVPPMALEGFAGNGSTKVDVHAEPDESFTAWWATYPRRNGKRVGRGEALRVWSRLKPAERGAAQIAVRNYAAAVADDMTIAKDPHRWLRARCWEDWLEPAVRDVRGWGAPRASDSAAHCLAMTIQERGF